MAGQTPGSAAGGMKQVFVTGLTETSLVDLEGKGTIRFENGKWYKWVLYDDGTDTLDIVAGDFLCYVALTGYLASLVTADVSDSDDTTPMGAGIATGTVTVDQTYMWIQIKGGATLSLDPGAGAPGDSETVVPSATDKKVAVATSSDLEHHIGFILDDSEKTIYLDCPW